MNKRRILILLVVLTIAVGFTISSVSSGSVNGYIKYKGSFKLKHDSSQDMYYNGIKVKEWKVGKKGAYVGSSEINSVKNRGGLKKTSVLRIGNNNVNSNFKAVVKFRYWNGYKYTNKYKTKTYIKKYGYANTYTVTKNWIPYSIKIYTKK